jgi:hypothetical protein
MKKFNQLTPKEIGLWEEHVQFVMQIRISIPENLLRSCWESRYKKEHTIYHPIWNTRPSKEPKILEPEEEHRTYVENITYSYNECV